MSPSTLRRVERCNKAIEKLTTLSKIKLRQYMADSDSQDIAERNLQVAIEAVLDLALSIAALKEWRTPATYREAPRLLAEHGILKTRLAESLGALTGLRNILVHGYAEISAEMVHQSLGSSVATLKQAIKELLNYAQQEKLNP